MESDGRSGDCRSRCAALSDFNSSGIADCSQCGWLDCGSFGRQGEAVAALRNCGVQSVWSVGWWQPWRRIATVPGGRVERLRLFGMCGLESVRAGGLRQPWEAGRNGCGSLRCVQTAVGVDRHCDSLWRRSGADACSYSYTDLRFPCGSSPVCFSKLREAVSASGGRSSLRSRRALIRAEMRLRMPVRQGTKRSGGGWSLGCTDGNRQRVRRRPIRFFRVETEYECCRSVVYDCPGPAGFV